MFKTAKMDVRYPQTQCEFCAVRTPHLHERRAVAGRMVVRSICLTCHKERPANIDHAS